ncbi:protein kinase [Candidatus Riflebacteria bacterium]
MEKPDTKAAFLKKAQSLLATEDRDSIRNFLQDLIPYIEKTVLVDENLDEKEGSEETEEEDHESLLAHVPFIQKLELFKNMRHDERNSILRAMQIHTYAAGDFIIKKGEIGDCLFIVISGSVEVVIETPAGERKRVTTFGSREIFGEIALLTGEPRTADVLAIEATTCFVLNKKDFNQLCHVNPHVSLILTKLLADRLGSDSTSMVEKRIGDKYQIMKKIGEGGMGIVYRAQDTNLGRIVAMKMLPHPLVFNENFVKKFSEEGKLVARLDHENIVRLYDVANAYATYFMVMEYMGGASLEDVLEEEKILPIEKVVDIIEQLAPALEHSRQIGIVHRDIKPDNIKFTSDGKVKLMDFGIAVSQVEDDLDDPEYMGGTAGTIRYMSPEQGQGREVDYRADIYSFGVVCFQMLTGRTPFAGRTHTSIVIQQLAKPVPRPSSINKEIPPWLDDFIVYSLDKNVDKRLGSYED